MILDLLILTYIPDPPHFRAIDGGAYVIFQF